MQLYQNKIEVIVILEDFHDHVPTSKVTILHIIHSWAVEHAIEEQRKVFQTMQDEQDWKHTALLQLLSNHA